MDPITLFIIQTLLGIALEVGADLLTPSQPGDAPAGSKDTITIGENEPLSFGVGRFGTAGHLEYASTWGTIGGTPNAFRTDVISLSDLPVRGLRRVALDGVWCTILDDVEYGAGWPIAEYRVYAENGIDFVDYAFIRFWDGTQTTPNAFLRDTFGADPDRPWLEDMIGRGIAYATMTVLWNPDLFQGGISDDFYFFELDGVELDDPRGDDAQENPIVQVRQTLKGFYYGDEWVWGLQGLPDNRTPSANWEAQMDECDPLINLKGGGAEVRFRSGIEIKVNQQPIDVIPDFLDACSGRIAEIGGVYKVLVAGPGEPVHSFTDEEIIISEAQSFDPFPSLNDTYNAINSTYVEPEETWASKPAPFLIDADMMAEDGGRQLPADVQHRCVFSGTQAQRLDKAALKDKRRWRTNTQTFGPAWWEYEVLDPVAWTSDRNGYDDKVAIIAMMDDLPNANQFVQLKEQDPSDYSWDEEVDEQAIEPVPLVVQRPAPQLMTGWTVVPSTMEDPDGNGWLPTIEVGFDLGLVDVVEVRIQVREGWDTKRLIFDGTIDYRTATTPQLINASFLPSADYEARGIYVPGTLRIVRWSNQDVDGAEGAWLAVTTPDVSPVPPKSIFLAQLGQDLQNWNSYLSGNYTGSLSDQIAQLVAQFGDIAQAIVVNELGRKQRITTLVARQGAASAAIVRNEEAIATETEARASLEEDVAAIFGGDLAESYLFMESSVAPDGVSAQVIAKVRAVHGEVTAQGATILRAAVDENGLTSAYFGVLGALYVYASADGEALPVFTADDDGVTFSTGFFNILKSIAVTGTGDPIIYINGITGAFSITVP